MRPQLGCSAPRSVLTWQAIRHQASAPGVLALHGTELARFHGVEVLPHRGKRWVFRFRTTVLGEAQPLPYPVPHYELSTLMAVLMQDYRPRWGWWKEAEVVSSVGKVLSRCRDRVGYVYFVEDSSSGLVKVGFTINPRSRFSTLQSEAGAPRQMLRLVPSQLSGESALHRRFRECRVRGEWFRPDRSMWRFIANTPRFGWGAFPRDRIALIDEWRPPRQNYRPLRA